MTSSNTSLSRVHNRHFSTFVNCESTTHLRLMAGEGPISDKATVADERKST